MNEIEKLCENARVTLKRCSECDNHDMDCGFGKDCYPPFTVEKQFELVKFLLNKSVYYDADGDISDEIKNSKYREFDKAIAECINKRWEDLREDERRQVKEILE